MVSQTSCGECDKQPPAFHCLDFSSELVERRQCDVQLPFIRQALYVSSGRVAVAQDYGRATGATQLPALGILSR